MIIQCPSCKTKFSLEPDQIAGIDSPKFHCSRCKYYFVLGEEFHQELFECHAEEEIEANNHNDAEQAELEQGLEIQQEEITEEEVDVDNYQTPGSAWPKVNWPNQSNLCSEQNTKYSQNDSNIIDDDYPDNPYFDEDPAAEQFVTQPFSEESFEDFEDTNYVLHNDLPEEPIIESETAPIIAQLAEAEKLKKQSNFATSFFSNRKFFQRNEERSEVKAKEEKREEEPSEDAQNKLTNIKEFTTKTFASAFHSLSNIAFCVSVPLVFLIGLFFWSKNLNLTPTSINKIFHIEANNLPEIPPVGLELTGLKSNYTVLATGQQLLTLDGSIFNASSNAFQEIVIEAKIYDKNNKRLSRVFATPNQNLLDARISNLAPETIKKIQDHLPQSDSGTKDNEKLKPQTKLPFRIFFTDLPKYENLPYWFSTRIYSTKKVRSI